MAMHVCQILEATEGGTRTHLHDLVLGLAEQGVRVTVIASLRRDASMADDLAAFREAGATTYAVDMRRAVRPGADAASARALPRILRAERPRLVHTHSAKAGMLGRWAARRVGVPAVVHTPHVFPFQMDCAPWQRALYRMLERRAAQWTGRVICVSRAEAEAARVAGIGPASRLTVVHNGITLPVPRGARAPARAALGLPADARVIGTIGRCVAQKGHADLIEALPALCEAVPKVHCAIVGTGPLRGALEARARALGVAARCTWLPERDHLAEVRSALDLFVLPSRWEGLPYALLEAMGSGLPVVATAVGGVPEVVRDGVDGTLVATASPTALAHAITALLRDPARAAAAGQAARERVAADFRREDMLAATRGIYEALLAEARVAP